MMSNNIQVLPWMRAPLTTKCRASTKDVGFAEGEVPHEKLNPAGTVADSVDTSIVSFTLDRQGLLLQQAPKVPPPPPR